MAVSDIEQVSTFKLLGVHLIEDLTWAVHCDYTVGTLTSNDANGKKNVKKTIGFFSKTTTLHVHHSFLRVYISLPVFPRLRREHA